MADSRQADAGVHDRGFGMEDEFIPPWYRPLRPDSCRRARWHDYRSPRIYMITVSKAAGIPAFSEILGVPGDPANPPRTGLTSVGRLILRQLKAIPSEFPHTEVWDTVIMPDHMHFLFRVKERTDVALGTIIGRFKGRCTAAAESPTSLFREGFHDRILSGPGQLKTLKDYIRDNPRRLLIKRMKPGFFTTLHRIWIADSEFSAFGNPLLLRNPDKAAVKVSRRYDAATLQALRVRWDETIRSGGVLVSPFIHPEEKAFRTRAINENGRIILLTAEPLMERPAAPGMLFEVAAQGRLLILSPLRNDYISPDMTYARAQVLNALAARIAAISPDDSLRLRR